MSDTYEYTPYGELQHHTGESNNSFLFTGEQFDPESHDYYLRARYYNPKSTRFMSRDSYDGTSANPITQNHYLYANANPMYFTDPSGNMSYAEQTNVLAVQSSLAGVAVAKASAIFGSRGEYGGSIWGSILDLEFTFLQRDILTFILMAGVLPEERTPEQAKEADRDYNDYKDYCKNGPKKSDFTNNCAFWKAQMEHSKQCISMMEQFDKSWTDGRHSDNSIAQWKQRLKKLENKIEKLCK